jgi:cellobiose phosphorylase
MYYKNKGGIMAEKTYKITAIRKDYVEIDILAKSKEEAIEKAKNDDHDSEWATYEFGDFSDYINLEEE